MFSMKYARPLAKILARSPILTRGRRLWDANERDWNLPLSKFDKIMAGVYIILHDYSQGHFPPTFNDQQKAYDAEVNYRFSLTGFAPTDYYDASMRKPFVFGKRLRKYVGAFIRLATILESLGIHPPQKLLELGCGNGWMSEFLALMKYDVVGTSISHHDIQDAETRIASARAKNLPVNLRFIATPMESANTTVAAELPFDCVYVFEALHHAYDWKEAIVSSYKSLKPGGWFVLCDEPNIVHVGVSYRVAKLSNTHEIGFSRAELMNQLKSVGFKDIRILKNRWGFGILSHWIAARK
jgi:2-polyprenyl-3-methyl-5-hydroxy-6-metoxy-1,4-benzoquinol methylase